MRRRLRPEHRETIVNTMESPEFNRAFDDFLNIYLDPNQEREEQTFEYLKNTAPEETPSFTNIALNNGFTGRYVSTNGSNAEKYPIEAVKARVKLVRWGGFLWRTPIFEQIITPFTESESAESDLPKEFRGYKVEYEHPIAILIS